MSFASLLATADRLVLATLGESVTYMPRAGPHVGETVTVPGVFQAAYVLAEFGEAGVSSSSPAVFVRASALPGYGTEHRDFDEDEAVVTRAGVEYAVRESRPDGEGGILFLLREVR